MECEILQSIIIGGAGGAIAGITILIVTFITKEIWRICKTNQVVSWFKKEIEEGREQWRNTHAIYSFNNLTEDEIRFLCSRSKRICRNSNPGEVWGIKEISRE